MLEGQLLDSRSDVTVRRYRQIRFPRHIRNTEIQSVTVIVGSHPFRKIPVIGRTRPLAGRIIQPEYSFSHMSGRKHRHLTHRSDGIHMCRTLTGCHQLVRQGRHQQVLRRSTLRSIDTHIGRVIHSLHQAQRIAAHPVITHYPVVIGSGSGIDGSHGRRMVQMIEIVFRIAVHAAFLEQTLETSLPIQSRKCLDVVGAQLVNGQPHHQFRHRRRVLCLQIGEHKSGNQGCEYAFFHCFFFQTNT